MRLKIPFTAGALALLLAGAVAGCHTAPDPDTVRFRYWGDIEEVKIMEGLIHDFEQAHPGAKIHMERKSPDASYSDILLQEFAAGVAPDVIFTSTDNSDMIMDGGRLMDLKPFIARDGDVKEADYYDTMIRRFTKDGKLYILPRDIAPVACVYYNKALFDAAHLPYPKDDWTWDDLRADAVALTKRRGDGTASQLGFADDWNLTDVWVLAGGGRQVDDYFKPTRFTFAEDGALEGILYRWRLLQVDGVMPTAGDNQALNGGASALFMNGNLAMFHSGLWKTPSFRHITAFGWDVAPFPRRAGVKPTYYCGGSGYGIRAGAANPDLCWKLVKYLSGPTGQTRFATTGLLQPSLKSLANSPVFLDGQDPKNKKMLLACAENGLTTPQWLPYIEFLRTLWSPLVEPIWIQGYKGDPAQLIKDVQRQANAKFFPSGK